MNNTFCLGIFFALVYFQAASSGPQGPQKLEYMGLGPGTMHKVDLELVFIR